MAFTRNYLHILLAASVILLYSINSLSFNDGKPTCENFIVNVYLYLSMLIVTVGLSCYMYNHLLNPPALRNVYLPPNTLYEDLGGYMIGSFLASIALIFYLSYSAPFDNANYMTVHAAWVAFAVTTSLMVYPYFKSSVMKDVVENALLLTGTIFVVMTSIAFAIPKFFGESYNFMTTSLTVSLIAVVLLELYNLMFNRNQASLLRSFRFTSYAVIFIITLFVSYDTYRMIKLEKECTSLPNYPKFSTSFFMDILNLFKRISFLKSMK